MRDGSQQRRRSNLKIFAGVLFRNLSDMLDKVVAHEADGGEYGRDGLENKNAIANVHELVTLEGGGQGIVDVGVPVVE